MSEDKYTRRDPVKAFWSPFQVQRAFNVAPLLVEGFGLMKSFRGIIQNQLLFEGFGIMKSFWDRNKKIADSES